MSSLIKNTSIYSIGLILPKIVNYILVPIYTRYMTTAEYGIVSSMTVMSAILLILFTFAIERSIYRIYYEYKDEQDKKDFLGTISILIYLISIIITCLSFVFRDTLSQVFQKIDFFPYYMYMIFGTYITVFTTVTKVILQVKEKPIIFVSISFSQFILNCLLIFVFVIHQHQGAVGMLKALLFSNLLILPVVLYINIKSVNFTFNKQMAIGAFKLSWPFIPSLLSAWILNLSNRIFIERYFSLSDVGVFSLAFTLAGVVLVVAGAFNQAYNPVFFKLANSKDQDESKSLIGRYNHIYALTILVFCFNLSFFSKDIIYYIFDEKFREATKLIPVISFAYLISQVSGLFNLMIYQKKKTKQLMLITFLGAMLSLLLNYMLIPKYGSIGAGWATMLSFLVVFILTYSFARRCYFVSIGLLKVIIYSVVLFSLVFVFNIENSVPIWKITIVKAFISCIVLYLFYYKINKTMGKVIVPFWKKVRITKE